VFPVAAVSEKEGTFVNWEGRGGGFGRALEVAGVQSDLQVLTAIADEMDVHLGLPDAEAARRELAGLGRWKGARPAAPNVLAAAGREPGPGQAVLATWHQLLDAGRLQDGEPYLAGTARAARAMMSVASAAGLGIADGDKVTVATEYGAITVAAELAAMPDRVIWLPANSQGCAVRRDLGVGHGALVTVRRSE